jgi:steroid 5-alpha reductase family enzyme
MSYVDIAWPFGLVSIGLLSFFYGEGHITRKIIISLIYIIAGLRMGVGALILLKKGYLNKELPRYQYQRIRWKKAGFSSEMISIQYEILLQCFANSTFLLLPALLISNNNLESISNLEIFGCILWIVFFVLEHISDLQKQRFLIRSKKLKLKNQVCNVGLWKYTRHPNYFSEWMLWNSLIILSIPSINFNDFENITLIGIVTSLFYISYLMYQTLVFLTGAVPSEYYSEQKRPNYKKYKESTSQFFPKIF